MSHWEKQPAPEVRMLKQKKGEAMPKSAVQIINEYIQMLQAGHVKEGLREATKEEIEFGTALLQAIAADIVAAAAWTGDTAAGGER